MNASDMLDFSSELEKIEKALKAEGYIPGTTQKLQHGLSPATISAVMFAVRSALNPNVVLSNLTPAFVKQKTAEMYMSLHFLLSEEVFESRISSAEKELLLESIDNIITACMLRALHGHTFDGLVESNKIKIEPPRPNQQVI